MAKQKKFDTNISFYRSKEDNWGIQDIAKSKKFDKDTISKMLYFGYEWDFDVTFLNNGDAIIKTMNSIEIFDKDGKPIIIKG